MGKEYFVLPVPSGGMFDIQILKKTFYQTLWAIWLHKSASINKASTEFLWSP